MEGIFTLNVTIFKFQFYYSNKINIYDLSIIIIQKIVNTFVQVYNRLIKILFSELKKLKTI